MQYLAGNRFGPAGELASLSVRSLPLVNLSLWHGEHSPRELSEPLKRRRLARRFRCHLSGLAHSFLRLGPRPCRVSRRRLADQLLVSDAAPNDAGEGPHEPHAVGELTGVEPEALLVKVAEQVEGLDGNVGSFDAAL